MGDSLWKSHTLGSWRRLALIFSTTESIATKRDNLTPSRHVKQNELGADLRFPTSLLQPPFCKTGLALSLLQQPVDELHMGLPMNLPVAYCSSLIVVAGAAHRNAQPRFVPIGLTVFSRDSLSCNNPRVNLGVFRWHIYCSRMCLLSVLYIEIGFHGFPNLFVDIGPKY